MNSIGNGQNHFFEPLYLRNCLFVPTTDCKFLFSRYELATTEKIRIVPFFIQNILNNIYNEKYSQTDSMKFDE